MLINFSSLAPIAPTPLGPHILSIEVRKADGSSLLEQQLPLHQLPSTQPASGSGVWRIAAPASSSGSSSASSTGRYGIILRRASINDALSVNVRITDPLQRIAEQVINIAAGSTTPLPSLSRIDAFSIVGRGHIYSFSTDAPDRDANGGIYRIHVAAVAKADSPFPQLDPKRVPKTATGGIALKSIEQGSLKIEGTNIPDLKKLLGQFTLKKGVFIFEGPLSTVKKQPKTPTLGNESLLLYRQSADRDNNFILLAKAGLSSLLVRITTPDGRSVEQRWKA